MGRGVLPRADLGRRAGRDLLVGRDGASRSSRSPRGPPRTSRSHTSTCSWSDSSCSVLAAYVVGGSTWGHVLIVLVGWLVPYVWGRFVLARVDADGCTPASRSRRPPRPCSGSSSSPPASTRSCGMPCPNAAWNTWHELQPRGGFVRSEGAFGHAIAFSSALAMSSVFVIATRWPVVARLACLSGDHHGGRDELQPDRNDHAGDHPGARGAPPRPLDRPDDAHRRRRPAARRRRDRRAHCSATSSPQRARRPSGARSTAPISWLLLGELRALGITTSWTVLPTGETYYGSFQSIDSELVLTGLRFGALPLIVLPQRSSPASSACSGDGPRPPPSPSRRRSRHSPPWRSSRSTGTSSGSSRASRSPRINLSEPTASLSRATNAPPQMEPEESECEGRERDDDEQHERGTGPRGAPEAMVDRARRHDPRRARRVRGIQHDDADLPFHGVPLLLVAHGLERLRHQPGFRLHAGADVVVRAGSRPPRSCSIRWRTTSTGTWPRTSSVG